MLKLLAENKKAYSLRPVFKLEGGLVLTGSEVKAIKEKNLSLSASYAKFVGGELYLIGLKLGRYKSSSDLKFEAEREKKVLLKNRTKVSKPAAEEAAIRKKRDDCVFFHD